MRHAILDPKRILRAPRGRQIPWHVSLRTHMAFREHLHRLVALEFEDLRDPAVQEEIEALREEIRRLPGFPVSYNVENDVIVPVTTSVMR